MRRSIAEDCITWAEQIELDAATFRKSLTDPVLETDRLAQPNGRRRGVVRPAVFHRRQPLVLGTTGLSCSNIIVKTMPRDSAPAAGGLTLDEWPDGRR